MNDDEVICKIKWTVADVKTAFQNKYGRLPSEGELKEDIRDLLYNKEQIMDEDGDLIDEKEQAFDLMFFGNYCNVDCNFEE